MKTIPLRIPRLNVEEFPYRSRRPYFSKEFVLTSEPNQPGDLQRQIETFNHIANLNKDDGWIIQFEHSSHNVEDLKKAAGAMPAVLARCNNTRLHRRMQITGCRLANLYRTRDTFTFCSHVLCLNWYHAAVIANGLHDVLAKKQTRIHANMKLIKRVNSPHFKQMQAYERKFSRESQLPYGSYCCDQFDNILSFSSRHGEYAPALLAYVLDIFKNDVQYISLGTDISLFRAEPIKEENGYNKTCRLTQQRSFRFKPYTQFGQWYNKIF